MDLPFYQVDAFTSEPFRGNPAAVFPLSAPLSASTMQSIAAEMNLAETAFVLPKSAEEFELRWFTPTVEVDLCGHATLAAAQVLWHLEALKAPDRLRFLSRSGPLLAEREGPYCVLDFPEQPVAYAPAPPHLVEALDVDPVWVGKTTADFLVEVRSERRVQDLTPDLAMLKEFLGVRGVIVTAESERPGVDFVSRVFAPAVGIDEDPVTGSTHCALAPYWAKRLKKRRMLGEQLSTRGGQVDVEMASGRVRLRGTGYLIASGMLHLPG